MKLAVIGPSTNQSTTDSNIIFNITKYSSIQEGGLKDFLYAPIA